jgi:hypothetical protein
MKKCELVRGVKAKGCKTDECKIRLWGTREQNLDIQPASKIRNCRALIGRWL